MGSQLKVFAFILIQLKFFKFRFGLFCFFKSGSLAAQAVLELTRTLRMALDS